MASDQAPLQEAMEDLRLVEAQIHAVGIVLSAALFALGDALKAEARRARDERRAARQARQRA